MNSQQPSPLTVRAALGDLGEGLFGWERGLLHTLRRSLWQPARLAREYVEQRSQAPVRPLRYLLLAVAVYSAVCWWWLSEVGGGRAAQLGAEQLAQAEWITRNAAWMVGLVIPPMAWLLHIGSAGRISGMLALCLLAYVQANALLVNALLQTPAGQFAPLWLSYTINLLLLGYFLAAMANLHGAPRWRAWLLALFALVAGQLINAGVVLAALRWIRPLLP